MIGLGNGEGFEAVVENKTTSESLNEHQIQHHPAQDGKSAYTECYLETIDEPFRIKISKLPTMDLVTDWHCRCTIDGHDLDYPIWYNSVPFHDWDKVYQDEGGQVYSSDLIFAPLPTTDDKDEITFDPLAWNTLGSIELVLRRGAFTPSAMAKPFVASLTQGTADEKAKKFAYTVGHPGETYYRFIFKYRPRAVLIQHHIIEEPEVKEPPPLLRQRKRARTSVDTLQGQTKEDETDIDGDNSDDDESDESGDVKPDVTKRMRLLEEQVRNLRSENERLRAGDSSFDEPIDLTGEGKFSRVRPTSIIQPRPKQRPVDRSRL
ncbi:hypothetical protein IAT40_000555 [Kwoniella sp. CBS 6097]